MAHGLSAICALLTDSFRLIGGSRTADVQSTVHRLLAFDLGASGRGFQNRQRAAEVDRRLNASRNTIIGNLNGEGSRVI